METKNSVFFGENGLTSTSATHLCNIAREYLKNLESYLNSVTFISESIYVLGTSDKAVLSEGFEISDLKEIEDTLNTCGQLNTFIAWVSEAIKAKEEESNKIAKIGIIEFCKLFPEYAYDDYVSSSSIGEEENYKSKSLGDLTISVRFKYLKEEAFTATIGKYIHKGALDKAYKEALKTVHSKCKAQIKSDNNSIVIEEKVSSAPIEDIEKLLLELQSRRRNHEKELNSIKSKIEEGVSYYRETDRLARQAHNLEVASKMKEAALAYNKFIEEENKKIKNLKIIIPDGLKPIYEKLNSMDKK